MAAVSDGVNICGSCALSETFRWSTCLVPSLALLPQQMDVEWECHWTCRDKEGEWRKDADDADDTNAKERSPCPCHHASRHSSPMGEPPRSERGRGAAAAQVARTPCIMFHVVFTSPQAVHITLCRLFYALLVRLLVFHNQVVINVSFY